MVNGKKISNSEWESNPVGKSTETEDFPRERELIVIMGKEIGLRVKRNCLMSAVGADVTPLTEILATEEIIIQPLFGVNEERLKYEASSFTAATGVELPDLSVYYRVRAPDERLDELARNLGELESVKAAYVKPPAELPQLNNMAPTLKEAPPVTPDFTSRQEYLNPSPVGIDAHYAWTVPGGSGAGVGIIDIEGAWHFTHEDLLQNHGGVVGGIQSTNISWRNHGTAVIGEFSGDRNDIGITGICPEANVRAISIFGGMSSAGAIRQAADMLNPGDIILIELHRPGPRHNFEDRYDQKGYIAIEWWPDEFDAISYATSKGIIVVEAGGNGSENLDDPLYNISASGFPDDWTNPFNRSNRDSGAILVGAGAPPLGTHDRNIWGPDRSRLDFSNYGALIDAQGWGREVTTCGYGDLQGPEENEDLWYTDEFAGTSSASPIIVGTLGCIQGILHAQGNTPLTPAQARHYLRTTGSLQQDAPGRPSTQRIGNRPDLKQLIDCVTGELEEKIIGTVVNKSDNKPIANVRVSIDTGQSIVTDANGKYELTEVPVGIHSISAFKDGCNCACTVVIMEEAKVITADTLELDCEHVNINGIVLNKSDNRPIANAKVSTDTGQSTFTEMDGSYNLAEVPAGDRVITAFKEGCNCACTIVTLVEGEIVTARTLELVC